MSVPEVKKLLKRNKKKAVLQTIENCLIVLRNDPTLQGAIRQNILTDRQDIVKDVGWVRSSTSITDTDYQYIMHYLEHNYGLPFSDTKIKFRVDIKQADAVVKTFTVDNSSASKFTVYAHEEVINVAGEFQIVFTNLSPSNNTSNKDRTAIWNVEWTGCN